jgi:Na+/proline symporter
MSSVSQTLKAIAMAVGISVLCLLPPIVHFVTGPVGPAIGGYLAGSRMRLNGGQAAFLGLVIGVTVGILAPIIFVTIGNLDLSNFVLIFFGGFAAIYAMLLSGVAAYFGGSQARKEELTGWD